MGRSILNKILNTMKFKKHMTLSMLFISFSSFAQIESPKSDSLLILQIQNEIQQQATLQ